MSRALSRRVRKLEQIRHGKQRVVVVYEAEADPGAAERQIARLRAAGLISEADLIVCLQRFVEGPVPAPTINGKAVELPGE